MGITSKISQPEKGLLGSIGRPTVADRSSPKTIVSPSAWSGARREVETESVLGCGDIPPDQHIALHRIGRNVSKCMNARPLATHLSKHDESASPSSEMRQEILAGWRVRGKVCTDATTTNCNTGGSLAPVSPGPPSHPCTTHRIPPSPSPFSAPRCEGGISCIHGPSKSPRSVSGRGRVAGKMQWLSARHRRAQWRAASNRQRVSG